MSLLAIFALILSLNATINVQSLNSTCGSVSVNALARIAEPVQGVITGYTPFLIITLNSQLVPGNATLKTSALIPQTGQRLPISIQSLSAHKFIIKTMSTIPLDFPVLYIVEISGASKACRLKVLVKPPRRIPESNARQEKILVTNTAEKQLTRYDPLDFLDTNITPAERGHNVLISQLPGHQLGERKSLNKSSDRGILLFIAIAFLSTALIITVMDYLSSRRGIQQHASGA